WDAISHLRQGAYVNFVDVEGEERIRETYGDETYARLARVKAQYDPENVFSQNQNIKPAVKAAEAAA
ncbi:MAG TPA: BBE domain-containing protein, partial [Tepidiformaceae bacterium]|nr:BBE domain-containing protein [Tepidiformaceae bacterium]